MKKISSFFLVSILLSTLTSCNERSDIFEGIGVFYIIIPLILVGALIFYMVKKKKP